MLKYNFKLFILFLAIVLFAVLLKNGRIFDLGLIFRRSLVPVGAANSLISAPDQLSDEYQKLLVQNSSLQDLARENQELRALLGFKETRNLQLLLAKVVNRDPVNSNLLSINAGSRQGLKVGQAVVVNEGIMVGKILAVGTDFSWFRLLTDKFSKLAVSIGEAQSLAGLLSGTLGLSMNVSYVLSDYELKKGDLVASTLADPQIPSALVIGRIENVDFSEEELFKQAAVSPLVDYNTISLVAVIVSL